MILADTSSNHNFNIFGDIVNNDSTISLAYGSNAGDTLTVNGNYIGNNGSLELNTYFGDDQSPTDKFIVNGVASGSTQVKFKELNAIAGATDKGIHIIQTESSIGQAFYLKGGYVSAGAKDYSLSMIHENNQDNWYLTTSFSPKNPDIETYTPNPSAAIAIQQASNSLFNLRLEDREGAYSGLPPEAPGNLWIRTYGARDSFTSMHSQVRTKGHSHATQGGVGLMTLGDQNQFSLGLMAGYGTYNSNSHSRLTQRKAKADLHGYSIGAYATWLEKPSNTHSLYVDSWVQWNHFKNSVKTADDDRNTFKSRGITASLETGKSYLVSQNETLSWSVQPQAQVIFQGVKADSYRDNMGVKIESGKHNIQTRLGAKTYLDVPVSTLEDTNYRPYLELNWLNNSHPSSVVINQETYSVQGTRNQGEVRLGVEADITKNGQVWANTSYLSGSHNNRTVQGSLGVKHSF